MRAICYYSSTITNSSSSSSSSLAFTTDAAAAGRSSPAMKSLMNLGVAVSNPERLSVFKSLGSAIVRQFDVIPTTMSLALIPVDRRYSSSATCGWILPI